MLRPAQVVNLEPVPVVGQELELAPVLEPVLEPVQGLVLEPVQEPVLQVVLELAQVVNLELVPVPVLEPVLEPVVKSDQAAIRTFFLVLTPSIQISFSPRKKK